jgi:hypothetical protein
MMKRAKTDVISPIEPKKQKYRHAATSQTTVDSSDNASDDYFMHYQDRFWNACCDGDIDEVSALLAKMPREKTGDTIDGSWCWGESRMGAFKIAAELNRVSIVKLLLADDRFSQYVVQDDSIIQCAARLGHVEIVNCLIDAGVKADVALAANKKPEFTKAIKQHLLTRTQSKLASLLADVPLRSQKTQPHSLIDLSAVYIAPAIFHTSRLKLKKINSAEEAIMSYNALFKEHPVSGWPNTEGNAERAAQKFRIKDLFGYYSAPHSFADYNIYQSDTQTLVGRFGIKKHLGKGRIETDIYILKKAQQKGYGTEIMAGMIKHVIQPGLGQPYCESNLFTAPWMLKTVRYATFRGVNATCDLSNYASFSLHEKSKYRIRWSGDQLLLFYPPESPSYLKSAEINTLKNISSTLCSFFSQQKINKPRPPHIIKATTSMPVLVQALLRFLKQTEEPMSIITALCLLRNAPESAEKIKAALSKGKATKVVQFYAGGDEKRLWSSGSPYFFGQRVSQTLGFLKQHAQAQTAKNTG